MAVRVSKPEFNLKEKLLELDKPVGAIVGQITDLDAWAISSNYDTGNGSVDITSNWYQFSPDYIFPRIGSSMTQSSGIFLFPKTGLWRIDFIVGAWNQHNHTVNYFGGRIRYSTDSGGSYEHHYNSYDAIAGGSDHGANTVVGIFNVKDHNRTRVKFNTNTPASVNIFGSADQMRTGAIFTRFGDSF